MIYITNNTDVLRIPRITAGEADLLLLINQTTKKRYSVKFDDFLGEVYMIDITSIAADLETGQYDYYVMSGTTQLATGIIQVCDYAVTKNEFQPTYDIKQFEIR